MKRIVLSECVVVAAVAALAFTASAEAAVDFTAMERRVRAADVSEFEVLEVATHPAEGNTPASLDVVYVLRPSADSYIRCRIVLPEAPRWKSRLFATGNGGYAGGLSPFNWEQKMFMRRYGGAVVTTDMGTSRVTSGGKSCGTDWPENVWIDFASRATHLMATSAKAICASVYGALPAKAVFCGGSTGGCQGMSEAQRHPEDFDGILVIVAAFNRVGAESLHLHVWKQSHANDGTPLFAPEQFALLRDCAIDYMADKDEEYARGRFLTDPRLTSEQAKGVFDLAASRDSKLADPSLRKRLEAIYSPVVVDGRIVHPGAPFGTDIAGMAKQPGFFLFPCWAGSGPASAKSDWKAFNDWVERDGRRQNAMNPDLSAFKKRGGKLFMTAGLADATIDWTGILDYYEDVVRTMGGLESVREFFRLYLLPGQDHGCGGVASSGYWDRQLDAFMDWVENGKVPGRMSMTGMAGKAKGETYEVSAYPMKAVKENGKWVEKPFPRAAARIDAFYR